MEIKYSKFEINMWDIFFLVIYLSHLLGGIDILFNKKEKVGIFVGENRVSKKKNKKRKILNKYIEMHRNGDLKNHKEENIKPSFFMEVFKDILGYNSITSGRFELYFEKK